MTAKGRGALRSKMTSIKAMRLVAEQSGLKTDIPMNSMVSKLACASILVFASSAVAAQTTSQDSFLTWMNGIAQQDLEQRAQIIRGIHNLDQAASRKEFVRKKLLDDMGGLPDYRGPLNARMTGQIRTESYTIEKLIYESLPGFYVTANLYRPNAPGRYPAVLMQSGHTQEGKPEDQRMAANLALKGFVVLCFDPIGQGEREQTYSRQLDLPLAGWSVPEHIIMDAQAQLIGQGLVRYFIWDAIRSLDYLVSRPDVDSSRIGAAGCSGGGALTTFIGALDPRVKVVVPACYPSSFQTMFATAGPHGEMVFPQFLVSGLDTADLVELSAPTPWLLQATETDEYGFSHEGVHMVYEEAQDWYDLYHTRANVGFMVGPGSHGMPLVSREALYKWMIRYLKHGEGDSREEPVKMFSNGELTVTRTGHVEDLPGSRKLFEILNADLNAREKKSTIPELRAKLESLGIPTDGSPPKIAVQQERSGANGSEQVIQFETEGGVRLNATLYLPAASGRKPAVLIVKGARPANGMSLDAVAKKMAGEGRIVLELEPRSSHLKNDEGSYTGDWISAMQANLIGRDLAAMRAHDILRGLDLLAARPDVDPDSIHGVARGVAGVWLLLAAAADSRMSRIWLDRTPYSLRTALKNSVASDLSEAVIPGFALHWDLDDLVKAMGTRQVMWTDPANWVRGVVALGPPFRYRYVLGDLTDEADVQDDALIREFLQ
jgi:cephalosporin-C deacetylase-like acetyl esterase